MSVGFSSWTISVGYTAQAQLNITTDRVVDINNYFEFAGEAKYFDYTSEGIAMDEVINPSSAEQIGSINIPFQIDVKSGTIKKHLNEGTTSFEIQTILIDKTTYTNTANDFFTVSSSNTSLYMNNSDKFLEEYKSISNSNSVANKELTSTFSFDHSTWLNGTKIYFQVEYNFTFSTTDFQSLYSGASGKFTFSFKAGVVL